MLLSAGKETGPCDGKSHSVAASKGVWKYRGWFSWRTQAPAACMRCARYVLARADLGILSGKHRGHAVTYKLQEPPIRQTLHVLAYPRWPHSPCSSRRLFLEVWVRPRPRAVNASTNAHSAHLGASSWGESWKLNLQDLGQKEKKKLIYVKGKLVRLRITTQPGGWCAVLMTGCIFYSRVG